MLVSGGEKQRLALSRAILKGSPIMFFDEATSALDTATEQSLLQAINKVLSGSRKTSIFVAHRLKTVQDADNIIVLRDGGVDEQGTHEQLMARNGTYRAMWEMQESNDPI